MKKLWGANEVGQFFVTGATNAAGKPSHFYCRVCRKDVSVLTHGAHEILRHYQGVKHFARDQRLRLETPGWRVLDLEGDPLSETELERRREQILRGLLVVRDREYPFAEDLIIDESGAPDTTLPVVAKVSSLIETLRLGGPYELVSQLWAQFTLIASRVNIEVAWSRDEVLVGIILLALTMHLCLLAYWCCVLVDRLERDVPRMLVRVFGWVKSHGRCSIEFEERGCEIWVMVRTWERSTFRRVCIAVLNRFSTNTTLEATVLGKILDAAGPDVAVVSIHGGPHVLAEAFVKYLGSQNYLSTPHLICGWWSVVSSALLRASLGALTRSHWRNLLWTAWKEQKLETGWLLVQLCTRPSSPMSCPCLALLMWWRTLLGYGLWSCHTSKRLAEKTKEIVLW